MFGWPLNSPFCTLHIDLFSMGEVEGDGIQEHVMNMMCDMTQFVITTPVPDTAAHVLTPIFMQEVLLKVGFCVMVVVDDGSTFKGLFVEMCKILKLRCHVLARNNHQALCVERFHVFLNKTLRIATNDQDSIKVVYIPASALTACAWNSAPIEGIDIVCSVSAVGREFKFPFDFEYVQSPTMSENEASAIHEYLTLAGKNGRFAAEIIKLLLEGKRMIQREKINEGRHAIQYKVHDVVTVRVQVQSDASRGRVVKMMYKSKGPFFVMSSLNNGSYMLQRWNKPDSALLKYHSSDMYLLPAGLLPSDPLDTPDLCYLNSSHGIIVNRLKLNLDIKMFNEEWFDGHLLTDEPHVKLLPLPHPPVRARTDARKNTSAQRATQLRSVLARVYAVSRHNQITTTVP
jgi:hypothetical protein